MYTCLTSPLDFVEILRCFNFLLKRLETSFWDDEPSEYPLIVFDVIKNNSALGKLLQKPDSSGSVIEKSWYLSWIFEYFHSVQKMEAIYDTVVAKISDFLLEELQHERFGDARMPILESAARVSVYIG
jgi:senataxin